jgi:deoxycytidine triphosphate deaminase
VHSGQFDAGFNTEKMGCFLQVNHPINIEKGARIAQAIVTESYEVMDEDLYNGQWQGDKQRN